MGFVKSYIQRFAYSSVTTDDWKNYLFTYFKDKVRKHLGGASGVTYLLRTFWHYGPTWTFLV